MEEGSSLDRIFLITLLCIGLFILTKRRFKWSTAIEENLCLMLLITYIFISILWSDIPYVSFKRFVRALVAIVMAFLVSTEQNPRQAIQSLLMRTIYILVPFSYILIHYFPEYGREYGRWSGELMWVGVTTQKNGLGRLCAISAFILIWELISRWRGRHIPVARYQTPVEVFLLFLTIRLLIGPPESYSATAVATLIAGIVAMFFLWLIKKRDIILGMKTIVSIIVIFIAIGTIMPFVGAESFAGISSFFGRNETLTGRVDIWFQLVPAFMKQPILGGGFGSFWRTETRNFYEMSHAHNGYIEILLELGFVGIVFFSLFLLSSCRKAYKEMIHNFDFGVLWISFILMTVLYNITESSQTFMTHHMAIVLFFTVFSVHRLRSTPDHNSPTLDHQLT